MCEPVAQVHGAGAIYAYTIMYHTGDKRFASAVQYASIIVALDEAPDALQAAILRRLNAVIKDTGRSPYTGIGKPEPLQGDLSAWWARRITDEPRLVYRISGMQGGQILEIAACRWHY
ncbi:MAG: Txe/YoeB family addiction module toxin [Acetobacteraceae bacterium]